MSRLRPRKFCASAGGTSGALWPAQNWQLRAPITAWAGHAPVRRGGRVNRALVAISETPLPRCRARLFAPAYTLPRRSTHPPAHPRGRLSSEQSARSAAARRLLRRVPYPPLRVRSDAGAVGRPLDPCRPWPNSLAIASSCESASERPVVTHCRCSMRMTVAAASAATRVCSQQRWSRIAMQPEAT